MFYTLTDVVFNSLQHFFSFQVLVDLPVHLHHVLVPRVAALAGCIPVLDENWRYTFTPAICVTPKRVALVASVPPSVYDVVV
jgi:hypothetical protein